MAPSKHHHHNKLKQPPPPPPPPASSSPSTTTTTITHTGTLPSSGLLKYTIETYTHTHTHTHTPPRLLTLEFTDKESMTAMLGRISHFSESKEGKGQAPTTQAEASRGYFGHNFPLSVLWAFVQGAHTHTHTHTPGGLTQAEKELVALCRKGGMGEEKGRKGEGRHYLIAYIKNDFATKQHELRHARFYLDPAYKERVTEAFHTLPEKQKTYITQFLSRLGYHEEVHVDEFQAFHLTEKANFWGIKVEWEYEE